MSYDLYLKPRFGDISLENWLSYFKNRENYNHTEDEFDYYNKDTGVYFDFSFHPHKTSNATSSDINSELTEEEILADALYDSCPVSFNINYSRPSYFALEAELELTNLIQHFDMVMLDPQNKSEDFIEYSPENFLSTWNRVNYSTAQILIDQGYSEKRYTLPKDILHKLWSWNYDREAKMVTLGEDLYAPIIWPVNFQEQTMTMTLWLDGLPCLLPKTDIVLIERKDLKKSNIFEIGGKDHAIVPWSDIEWIVERHSDAIDHDTCFLSYDHIPKDIKEFIKKFASF